MRHEIKIPINQNFDLAFRNWKDSQKFIYRPYKDRVVNSIYFDTDNHDTARDNLSGISRRFKCRLRWYGNENKYFYEIKIKENNVGKKIITSSSKKIPKLKDAFSYKNKFLKEKENRHFFELINNYQFKPILKVSYKRSYFTFNRKIRFTYDRDIKYEKINLNKISSRTIKDPMNVLEIKFEKDNLKYARQLIHNSNFLPKRFSKYLRGLYLSGNAIYI